jgi:hypothetical protein
MKGLEKTFFAVGRAEEKKPKGKSHHPTGRLGYGLYFVLLLLLFLKNIYIIRT